MKIYGLLGIAALCTLLFAFNLGVSSEKEERSEEIHRVMNQIFKQHVQSNTMTTAIMRDAVWNYIEQFDPNHIYLLEREVAPYQNLSEAEALQILNEYQESRYTIFHEIDALIQQSILRARGLREEVVLEKATLFKKQGVENFSESFPKTLKELRENIKNNIITYVDGQKKRFGESFIMKHPTQTIDAYQAKAEAHEDHYLFVDQNGEPLPKSEENNLFSLHVLKAIAKSLDENTEVLSPSQANDMMIRLEKGYPGIGIVLQQRPKGIYITRLLENGPAARSGEIKINDRVLEVDGIPVEDETIEEVLQKLHGKKGTSVDLTLERKVKEGHRYIEKTYPVTLKREYIAVDEGRVESSFEMMGNGIIGKIKLNSFYRGPDGVTSENDVRRAVQKLDKQGNLRGLILDLRENSGGYLTEAVKVAGLFITNGVIVTAKYSNGKEIIFRDVDKQDLFDGPIVVLTSKATASAAEIVAQALQDYGVAIVVGDEKTYGKGTIQNQTVTQNDGSSYFKVTIGKYYTVSGKTPDHFGVKADIVVPSQFTFLNFGNETMSSQNDQISEAYSDKLRGIPAEKRDWFVRYYVPSMQPKMDSWRALIPSLKKNSSYRISKNKDYQLFLKHSGHPVAKVVEESDEEDTSHEKNYGVEDLQMVEAVNIVRDMILLHHKAEGLKVAQAAERERVAN